MALLRKFYNNPGRYDEAQSVAANLRALVSTRRGYGSFVRDMGLTDIAGMEDGPAAARRVKEELEALISRYEPRLSDVQLKVAQEAASGGRLTLSLSATLAGSPRVFYLSLDPRTASSDVRIGGGGSSAP